MGAGAAAPAGAAAAGVALVVLAPAVAFLGTFFRMSCGKEHRWGCKTRDCQVPGLALGVSVSGLAWLALNMHALAVATLPSWATCMLDSSHAAKLGIEMMIGFDKHVQQAGGAAAYRAGGCEVGATHTSVQPVHSTASGHGSLLLARHSVCTSRVYGLCAARLGTSCSHS